MSESLDFIRRWRMTAADVSLEEFEHIVLQRKAEADYRLAADVIHGVPIYHAADLESGRGPVQEALMAEIALALAEGAGLCVVQGAYWDEAVLDRATQVFHEIIVRQRTENAQTGDHFAPPGTNDRVWGALDKFCFADPGGFCDYYASSTIGRISRAVLGPYYQVTSQVNLVRPGCPAQRPHCDYHLGFLDAGTLAEFPATAHIISGLLTLQFAIAHGDMPLNSGPTMFLPYSQTYPARYLAAHQVAFGKYFENHYIQIALKKGDVVAFNPGVMHAAGANQTAGYDRLANLLQVSSAFGRPIELVNHTAMCLCLLDILKAKAKEGWPDEKIKNVVAVAAEGYPFPTNLDLDPPREHLVPLSSAELLTRAIEERWSKEELSAQLRAMEALRQRNLPDGD